MKILVITAGLNPTPGASNSYQEALMESLAARGHEVVCICTADTASKPGIHWTRRSSNPAGYRIHNGGVYPASYPQGGIGTQNPARDVLASRALRRTILEVVGHEKPDLINIQSFFGLPFSLVAELKRLGPKLVFTAHDFFPLCPTAHLFTIDQQLCRLSERDLTCHRCCAAAPSYPVFWITVQLNRWIDRLRQPTGRRWAQRLRNGLGRIDRQWSRLRARPEGYRRRQHAAAEALHQLDAIQCISNLQAAQIQRIAGSLPNLIVLPLVPPTLPAVSVHRDPLEPDTPLRLVALNVHGSYKGLHLLERVFRRLAVTGVNYELHLHGNVLPGPFIPRVIYHGRYHSTDLDTIARRADFCLVPSLCYETLGFVGLEMMARGVPLIVSARAGVKEFVVPDVTGLVFEPEPDDVLHSLLENLITHPEQAGMFRRNLTARVNRLKSFESHVDDMVALFHNSLRR